MNFVESKMIRRTMASGLNPLLIASFIAAPASVVLLPTLSYAAPLPFAPLWMAQIVANLRHGRLLEDDIKTLIARGKESYKNLLSIISRINQLAAQQKLPYRLKIRASRQFLIRSRLAITVTVVNIKTKVESDAY